MKIALENIIIGNVTTHSASKVKRIDTSSPMEISMAAGTDGDKAFEEGTEKHLNSQRSQRWMEWRRGSQLERTVERVKKERIGLERDSGPRPEARKEEKGKRKVSAVTSEFVGAVGKQDTLRQIAPR